MVRSAREYCWWPNIDKGINTFIRRCQTCQVNARKRRKFHLSSWEKTRYFLERVHVDIAHWQDYRFLVLVDSHYKRIDVRLLKDLTASASICALCRAVNYIGLPTIIQGVPKVTLQLVSLITF